MLSLVSPYSYIELFYLQFDMFSSLCPHLLGDDTNLRCVFRQVQIFCKFQEKVPTSIIMLSTPSFLHELYLTIIRSYSVIAYYLKLDAFASLYLCAMRIKN